MEQVIVNESDVQPLAEWNGLVYYQGMYVTEAEKQAYLNEEEQVAMKWQAWMDEKSGKKNASELDVILSVFYSYYQATLQEIQKAARYLKETSLENFDFDSVSYVSALNYVKSTVIRFKQIKRIVSLSYDALGTPLNKVTKGKGIKAYLDSIDKGLDLYYNFGNQLVKGHKVARQKAIEDYNL